MRVAGGLVVGITVLLICVLVASASADNPPPIQEGMQEATSPVPHPEEAQISQAFEAARRKEKEREEELEQPRFVAEREASRHKFAEADATEVEELLRSKFGETLAELNADPGRFLGDAKLDQALGEGAAVVTKEGQTSLMEGPIPIEEKDKEGQVKKVDLDLEPSPEGFEPENPIVETVIGKTAEEGVELGNGSGESIEISQSGAEDSEGQQFGEQNILYPEVEEGSDTSQLVSPTASGVELFDLLRSVDSPETIRYDLNLPPGAHVTPLAGGAAEITAEDGSSIGVIPKPHGVDAQGTYVPVSLEVEGDTVGLHTRHREEDLAYPVLIDPEVIYEDWMHPNWYENQRLEALNYWHFYTNAPSFYWHGFGDEQWPGHSGLFIASSNAAKLPVGTYAENVLFRNTGSYIRTATINYFWRANRSCTAPNPDPEPFDFDGLYDVVQNRWNEEHQNDANKYGNSRVLSWGHEFVEGMGTGSSGAEMPCWRDTGALAMELWWGDWAPPSISVSGMPTGWVALNNENRGITVQSTDEGLGVQRVWLIGIGSRGIQLEPRRVQRNARGSVRNEPEWLHLIPNERSIGGRRPPDRHREDDRSCRPR